ncbi:MAG: sulfur oxidation c-type cytochrome SoxX, partial [Granulosicoccaceae bacterium]
MSLSLPAKPRMLLRCAVLLALSVPSLHADETQPATQTHGSSQHRQMPHGQGQHTGGGHGNGHHGGHGSITRGIENFPTIAYDGSKPTRAIEQAALPPMPGDPKIGRQLATSNKGRCLSCHSMGPGNEQAGSVGPDLGTYASSGRSRAYTFQQIWDARAHNPATLMPPFGTNGVLTRHEVLHIVAFLDTLDTAAPPPSRPQLDSPDYYVAGEDLTLADAYLEEGKALFHTPGKNGESCASCHAPGSKRGPDLKNVAAGYPKYDHALDRIMLIETRSNHCRQTHMHSQPYKLGSR